MRGYQYPVRYRAFSQKDIILYSLGIGFSSDPLNKDHFKFTYENDSNFQGFSTMPVLGVSEFFLEDRDVPGMVNFNPAMLLHGE